MVVCVASLEELWGRGVVDRTSKAELLEIYAALATVANYLGIETDKRIGIPSSSKLLLLSSIKLSLHILDALELDGSIYEFDDKMVSKLSEYLILKDVSFDELIEMAKRRRSATATQPTDQPH